MATNLRKRYIKDKWYGGMTTDEYIGQVGSVYDAEGVELRRNSKEVTLNRAVSSVTTIKAGTNKGELTCIYQKSFSSTVYWRLGGTSNGRIYDMRNPGNTEFTGEGPGYPIYTIGTIGTFGFYIDGRGNLNQWTYTTAADAGITGNTYPTGITSVNHPNLTTTGNCAPYVLIKDILVYGVGNQIYTVDTSISVWTNLKTIGLDSGVTIRAISKIGDQVVVYTGDDSLYTTGAAPQYTGQANGKTYYFTNDDLISGTQYSRSVPWNDRPILSVRNYNRTDYVVTGSQYQRQLFNFPGDQPSLITQSKISTATTGKFVFNPIYGQNSMHNIGNIILLPADGSIYTYGTSIPGIPESIVKEFTMSGYTPTCFWRDDVVGGTSTLYVGLRLNSESGINRNAYFCTIDLLNNYTSSGFITDNPIIGDWEGDKKMSVKFTIGMNLEANTSISIQASVNDGTFTTISPTITGGGYQRRPFVFTGNWNKIQFKYILSTTNTANTPHLFAGYHTYDVVAEDIIN